ncbi:hypothetical protein ACFC1R_29960 [Kitasatospora sp. NPDC056138]|uniref:hypothetical protein n=1 Tax=Kitasatospora sp. NPDC056138 TaxID=3345724 RepID=UPI0035DCB2CD
MTNHQPDADPDATIARTAVHEYLTARSEHWRQLAIATRDPDRQATYHAAENRLTRWREQGVLDSWVANDVLEAAKQNAAREHREALATPVGSAVSEAALQRVQAIRRWCRAQGYVLGDDVTEGE